MTQLSAVRPALDLRPAPGKHGAPKRLVVITAIVLAVAIGVVAGVSPALGIGLLAAIAVAVIVLTNLAAGLCVFVALSFLDGIPLVGSSLFSPPKVTGLLLGLACIREAGRRWDVARGAVKSRPGLYILLLTFTAWVLLSAIWARSSADTFAAAERLALNLLLVAIVLFVLRSRAQALALAIVLVASSAAAALYGLLSGPGPDSGDDIARLSGTLGDANELAAVLVAALPLSLALAVIAGRRYPWWRLAAAALSVFMVVGIVQTLSRGGLLALAAAGVGAFALVRRGRLPILAVVLVAVGGIGVYFTQFASPEALERVQNPEGGSGRSDLWRVAWRMAESEPIQGVGYGNFTIVSRNYFVEPGLTERADLVLDETLPVHNTHLQFLAELGFVGLALFLGLALYSLRCGVSAARNFERLGDRDLAALSYGAVTALVGYLIAAAFIPADFSKLLWLLMVLGPALLNVSSRAEWTSVATDADHSEARPTFLEGAHPGASRP